MTYTNELKFYRSELNFQTDYSIKKVTDVVESTVKTDWLQLMKGFKNVKVFAVKLFEPNVTFKAKFIVKKFTKEEIESWKNILRPVDKLLAKPIDFTPKNPITIIPDTEIDMIEKVAHQPDDPSEII